MTLSYHDMKNNGTSSSAYGTGPIGGAAGDEFGFEAANDSMVYADGDYLFMAVFGGYSGEVFGASLTPPGDWVEDATYIVLDSSGNPTLPNYRVGGFYHRRWNSLDDQSTYEAVWSKTDDALSIGIDGMGVVVRGMNAAPDWLFLDQPAYDTDIDGNMIYAPIECLDVTSYLKLATPFDFAGTLTIGEWKLNAPQPDFLQLYERFMLLGVGQSVFNITAPTWDYFKVNGTIDTGFSRSAFEDPTLPDEDPIRIVRGGS